MTQPHLWWQRGVVYQVYPRSLDVLAYLRETSDDRFLVAMNLGERPGELVLGPELRGGRVELSTLADTGRDALGEMVRLRPNEGLIIGLPSARAR